MGAGFDYAAHGLLPPPARPAIPGGGPQTLASVLDRGLAAHPAREALVGRHGRYDYAGLDRAANRAAHALAALGVRRGDRVAACLPNDTEIVIALLGCARLGAIWVGVNRPLAAPEKAFLLRDSGARVYLATPEMVKEIGPERAGLPALEHVVAVDPGAAHDEFAARLAAAPETRPAVRVDAFDPAAIAYTSGTTGVPKGAVHSHHNLLLPGAVAVAAGAYGPELSQGVVLPLTILNLVVLAPLTAFQDGSTCVCIDRTDPEGLSAFVRAERVGHFAAVPTIFYDLLTHPNVKPDDLASLRRPEVGGAECPEAFRRLYRERFGADMTIGYGMTEAPTAVARSGGEAAPEPGLCGRAVPQVELSIRDAAGALLPPGEVGEICVGPARSGAFAGVYTPMLGYFGRPDATREALRGGVYHSGDLGLLTPEGELYLRGRRSELILRGGANVYPAEVERVLQAHPAVAACAVLGVPDARLGERVVGAVQLEPGTRVDAEALRAHARGRLARYKVPEVLRVVDALPRNAMGKVVKPRLRALFDGGAGPLPGDAGRRADPGRSRSWP